MITADAGILNLKHKILEEVAKMAWEEDMTEEAKDRLIYEISPGPRAQYRCCVYKERELVKQRIRLASGLNPTPLSTSNNVVQVLSPACEECPIASYTVTDNCRLCMGKACLNAC